MAFAPHATKIQALGDERRRRDPPSDSDLLQRILEAHGAVLEAGLERDAVMAAILDRAQALTHSSGAVVELIDGDELVYGATSGTLEGLSGLRVSVDQSLSGLSVRTGEVLRCDDSEDDPRVDCMACRKTGLRSMLVAPLPFAGRTIGVLKVVSPYVRTYSDSDVRTLQHLNALMGAALGKANQYAAAQTELVAHRAALPRASERDTIQRVVSEGRFSLVFQPIVNLTTRRVLGFEALMRLHEPSGTTDQWFEQVRRNGLERLVDAAILRQATEALRDLPDGTYLAVNVSPDSLVSEEIENLCLAVAPERLVLELTEHHAVRDYAGVVARSRALRRAGIRLAIDDMGAGFSSLRHVLQLQPDFIKLDRSIVADIDLHVRHQILVGSLLTFARGTRSVLMAEGIETEAHLHALLRAGIEVGQGYFLRAPAPSLADAASIPHRHGRTHP